MKGHVHKCSRCKQPFACAGDMVRNFDGWPELVCDLFHLTGGNFTQCETCVMTTWCDHCGERAATTERDGYRVCLTCAAERVSA